MEEANSFLGAGWSFPPTFSKFGKQISLQTASGNQDIQESLRIILTTIPGERVMLPLFGADTSELIFEELDEAFRINLNDTISDAILNYEPRIQLDEVIIELDRHLEGVVNVDIQYTILQHNTRTNVVFPFFLIEGTEITRI